MKLLSPSLPKGSARYSIYLKYRLDNDPQAALQESKAGEWQLNLK
ncbi:hypothetical protein STRDD11_01795 [Streptococcus sp. DD11]|nr:hypothetical protein STRDD11_01795 [Streptococcus sp. DD11]